jgi:Raf kinase inhibitor-like YbhB/YbcL family protein
VKPMAVLCVTAFALLLMGCAKEEPRGAASEGQPQEPTMEEASESVSDFQLVSSAFEDGGMIPAKYTCDGDNVSPPLAWTYPPDGTAGFALVMDDPDAEEVAGKIWVHWLFYNLPADARSLPEAVPRGLALYPNARAGKGDSGDGYFGPCPPKGRAHGDHFKLYALDADLDLRGGMLKPELLEAMDGHVLALAELVGEYRRAE